MSVKEDIVQKIKTLYPNSEVYLNMSEDCNHVRMYVISSSFEGMSLIKQHQSIMKELKTKFKNEIHALHLKTLTPSQWKKQKKFLMG